MFPARRHRSAALSDVPLYVITCPGSTTQTHPVKLHTKTYIPLHSAHHAHSGVNEYKQKIYFAGQFMDPDSLLSAFDLADGAELKLLVKMSKITNKPALDNTQQAARAPARLGVPASAAAGPTGDASGGSGGGLMGLGALAGKLRDLASVRVYVVCVSACVSLTG